MLCYASCYPDKLQVVVVIHTYSFMQHGYGVLEMDYFIMDYYNTIKVMYEWAAALDINLCFQ